MLESAMDQFKNSKCKYLKLTYEVSFPGQGSHWGQTTKNIFKIYE